MGNLWQASVVISWTDSLHSEWIREPFMLNFSYLSATLRWTLFPQADKGNSGKGAESCPPPLGLNLSAGCRWAVDCHVPGSETGRGWAASFRGRRVGTLPRGALEEECRPKKCRLFSCNTWSWKTDEQLRDGDRTYTCSFLSNRLRSSTEQNTQIK